MNPGTETPLVAVFRHNMFETRGSLAEWSRHVYRTKTVHMATLVSAKP